MHYSNPSLWAFLITQFGQEIKLIPCHGGMNHQSFYLQTPKQSYFLKYFHEHQQQHLKLEREWQFLRYLWQANVLYIAKPIEHWPEQGVLLTSWLIGEPITTLYEWQLLQARDFIIAINQPALTTSEHYAKLPIASDSFVNLQQAWQQVNQRLQQLLVENEHDGCQQFLQQQLQPKLLILKERIQKSPQHHWPLTALSPSDFGFHNSLQNQQQLYFFDFEYAGRDNLWKLTCDFFCQPRFAISSRWLELWLAPPIFQPLRQQPKLLMLLMQLTRLKWCLIQLNSFRTEALTQQQLLLNQEQQLQQTLQYFQQTVFI